jgi:hypothetical protein
LDEFQNLSSDSFVSILSEARKYHLCLTLSHQHTSQLRDEVRDAVFGNVGSIVTFRIGSADGLLLEREFSNAYRADQLTSLDKYQVCAKLLTDGAYNEPFLGVTLPPMNQYFGQRATIIRRSREKYASRRADVEDKIRRWLGR